MKNRFLKILFLSLLVHSLGFGQDRVRKTDSLWQAAEQEENALEKSEILLKYAQHLNARSNDSCLAFIDSLIGFYAEQKFAKALGRAKSMKCWFLNFGSQHERAIREGHEALKLQEKIKDTVGMALTKNRIGVSQLYFKRYDAAEEYISRALEQFILLKDTNRIETLLNNLGVVASEQKDFRKAIDFYTRSLAYRLEIGNYHWVAYSYYNIGDSYFRLEQLDSAKKYLLLAVETFKTKTDHHKVPAMVEMGTAGLYREVGDYKRALEFAERALQKSEDSGQKEIAAPARKILADILYKLGRHKDAYEMSLAYQELQSEIDSVNNAAAVAEIEGKFETAEKEARIAKLESEALGAQNRAQRSWVTTLAAVLAAVIAIALLIFLYQKRFQKQKIKEADLNARLSEIKMVALRAQMNPHFIFNCINTTQNFVLNSDKEQAYDYLSKFACLLRMVLENSDKSMVPLEDEIEQIKLYIELESIRFEGKFEYNFEIDPELENGVFEIPGMVAQPLVENAILHGLMNKKGEGGRLGIRVKKEDARILFEITDNGVGRPKAAEIKALKKKHYQSAALPNISERIELLRKKNKGKIGIEITDLQENGEATGTKVRVLLPYS